MQCDVRLEIAMTSNTFNVLVYIKIYKHYKCWGGIPPLKGLGVQGKIVYSFLDRVDHGVFKTFYGIKKYYSLNLKISHL